MYVFFTKHGLQKLTLTYTLKYGNRFDPVVTWDHYCFCIFGKYNNKTQWNTNPETWKLKEKRRKENRKSINGTVHIADLVLLFSPIKPSHHAPPTSHPPTSLPLHHHHTMITTFVLIITLITWVTKTESLSHFTIAKIRIIYILETCTVACIKIE